MGLFKERIFSGFSLSNFTRVRDVLASNHIWYTTKVRDLSGGTGLGASRAVTGSFGIKPDSSKEYEAVSYTHLDVYKRQIIGFLYGRGLRSLVD